MLGRVMASVLEDRHEIEEPAALQGGRP
jgi:hypothetical protein